MANTLRIKRRPSTGSAGSPSAASLYNGELAFNENDNTLYYAYGSGTGGVSQSVPAIGGSGSYSLRGGTNATGTWPISINGNAAYATNAVYTTGTQTVNGAKTFGDATIFNSGLSSLRGVSISPNSLGTAFTINDASGSAIAINRSSDTVLIIRNDGYFGIGQNITDITAADFNVDTSGNINGGKWNATTIPVNKGGTGRTSYSNGQLLIGSGTSLVANALTQGDGVVITNGSGTIGIAVDSTVVRTTGVQTISDRKLFSSGLSLGANPLSLNPTLFIQTPDTSNSASACKIVDSAYTTILDIRNDGNMGIGAFAGISNRLNIKGSTSDSTLAALSVVNSGGNSILYVRNDGNVGIGTNTPSGQLHVIGSGIFSSGLNIANQTASTIASFDANKNVTSLSTATYPSLTELTYVKGVTSAIQTQIDGKAATSQNMYIGTTLFTINRSSASQTLTGISIDGNAGTVTSGVYTSGSYADPIWISSLAKSKIGLSNVTNDAQIKKLASSTDGYIPTWNGTTGDALNNGYSVQTTLSSSSTAIPRADAVKTYVDNSIASGFTTNDAMLFKGAIDCSTNPNYPSGDAGWTYKISFAGKIGGASGSTVEVNDTIICTVDGTPGGTQASVGSNWVILQTNIVDSSILVTGPASATSGNFAMFDGTTGKIVKDSSLNSSSFATASHTHGNISNVGAIGLSANLPIITTTNGVLTTGAFGTTANTFCQGNDSRLSDTRNTTNSITVNNGGAGDASSFTFNGSAARTISYNSIGAPSISGTNATGTWNIAITGNAGFVTNGVYTTGTQTIGGLKTFSSKVTISNAGASTSLNINNGADQYFDYYAGQQGVSTGYFLAGLHSDTSSAPFRIVFDTDGSTAYITNGIWNASTIAVNKGGTGQSSYTIGDLLYADSSSTLAKLADVATGNVLLAGGVGAAPSWGKVGLTTHVNGTLPVANGGTNQTSFTDGQLLIGNSTGNTLSKATLTQGTGLAITNGNGSISIAHASTSSLTGSQGGNGIASLTVDPFGHVTAVTTATYLTAATFCAAIVDCTLDGGTF